MAISIQNLSCSAGKRAIINNASVSVLGGEARLVCGRQGILLTRLLSAITKQPLVDCTTPRAGIGRRRLPFGFMRAEEYLLYCVGADRQTLSQKQQRVYACADIVGLSRAALNKRLKRLGALERWLVHLAAALLPRPHSIYIVVGNLPPSAVNAAIEAVKGAGCAVLAATARLDMSALPCFLPQGDEDVYFDASQSPA